MWDLTKLDDIEGASDLSTRQFPSIPIDAIDSFYNSQGNIRATKSDLEVDPAIGDKKREEYRSKPKTKNKGKCVNNKKIRLKDQPKIPSFPIHLLQKNDPPIEGVPTAVSKELQSFLDQAQFQGMEQIDDSIYYDSNSEANDYDEDDDNTFQDAIQVEDIIDDTDDDHNTIYGEQINNDFIAPIGIEDGATRVTIKHEGILHAQYCHYG